MPMEGMQGKCHLSTETSSYVVPFTCRRQTVSKSKGKHRICKRGERKREKSITENLATVNLVSTFWGVN